MIKKQTTKTQFYISIIFYYSTVIELLYEMGLKVSNAFSEFLYSSQLVSS